MAAIRTGRRPIPKSELLKYPRILPKKAPVWKVVTMLDCRAARADAVAAVSNPNLPWKEVSARVPPIKPPS